MILLALVGLGIGIGGAFVQKHERDKSDADAVKSKMDLADLQSSVGHLAEVDKRVEEKTKDLTILNNLGDAKYYVVIDTFSNTERDNKDCKGVRERLNYLFPDAEAKSFVWSKQTEENGKYELRFGRDLAVSGAQIFKQLADGGLANGKSVIRREREASKADNESEPMHCKP